MFRFWEHKEKGKEYKETYFEKFDFSKINNNVWLDVETRKSTIHGKGLFANNEISANHFIMEYKGRLMIRIKKGQLSNSNKVMEMSNHIIVSEKRGSEAQYINHENQPNSKFVKVIVDGFERCAVYSVKSIQKDEEITCACMVNEGKSRSFLVSIEYWGNNVIFWLGRYYKE